MYVRLVMTNFLHIFKCLWANLEVAQSKKLIFRDFQQQLSLSMLLINAVNQILNNAASLKNYFFEFLTFSDNFKKPER